MAAQYLWPVGFCPSRLRRSSADISAAGRNLQEWDKLAKWVVNHKLFSHNVRWLIQVPRLYEVYKGTGAIKNFGELVRSEVSSFGNRCLSLDLVLRQISSSPSLKSHRTLRATRNCIYSCSGSSDSTVWTTNLRLKDVCSGSSP